MTADTPRIAVTGATGRVGGGVARALAAGGLPLRLVVRDPSRAPDLPGADVRAAEHGDRESVVAALTGCEVVLMVSAGESADRVQRHLAFVDAAADAGVRHLVYTSFAGASSTATFTLARDHAATEARIRERLPRWTVLRDNLYADFLPVLAGEDGVLRGPAGSGRLAAVAIGDVVDVATEVLRHPEAHAGRTYELSGPEAFSLADAAALMTRVLGRPFRYEEETVEEAYRSREVYGAPDWQVEAWVSTYTAIAAGELERVSPHVSEVLGRPATSLEQLLARGLTSA
jgi:NAD(P)H dehydrogenase (quinone)